MTKARWLSEDDSDDFHAIIADLWTRTGRRLEMTDALDPVFGEGSTWFFWDETWSDCYGPVSSEEQAQVAVHQYGVFL